MNNCLYVLERVCVIVLVQQRQFEGLEPLSCVWKCREETLRSPWPHDGSDFVASLQELRSDMSTNKSSGTRKLERYATRSV